MAAKPKAGGAAKKTGDLKRQKEQSARFIKAARDAGVDGTGKAFDKALSAMGKARQK